MDKRELKFIKGVQFGWSAVDPLTPGHDVLDPWVSHRNKVVRLLIQKKRDIVAELINRRLKWKIVIEVEFKDPNGKTYYRGADMVVHGRLHESDGHYQGTLEDIFAESQMKHYVKTLITAEVLGVGAIEEKDFEESAPEPAMVGRM